jgi:hypothetical protein
MRAYELALLVACITAATVFLPELVGTAFGGSFAPSGYNYISGYNIANTLNLPMNPTPIDYFFLMVNMIILALTWFFQLLMALITLAPWLMNVFHFPWWLAVPIHVGVWFLIVIAAVQMWRAISIDVMR